MNRLSATDLRGVYTALVTPMLADGRLDKSAWRRLLRWQADAGVQGVVVAGTTGESAVLGDTEFAWLLSNAVEALQDTGVQVIAQTGSISPETVVQRNQLAASLGAQAVLVVVPYYFRTTQEGLLAHFHLIADASPLPVVLYNVPGRTVTDMAPETTAELAAHDNIIGIKEAKADMRRVAWLTDNCQDFTVLSGDDDSFLESMRHGACGVVSVASNARPRAVTAVVQAALARDWPAAEKGNRDLQGLYRLLTHEPNPMPVKWCLHQAGVIDNGIRLPLVWPPAPPHTLHWETEIHSIRQEYRS